jgi:hypothetical protein
MEEPKNFERNLMLISEAVANVACRDEPNITEGEIKRAAYNFAEFIRLLKTMDAEQKVTGLEK